MIKFTAETTILFFLVVKISPKDRLLIQLYLHEISGLVSYASKCIKHCRLLTSLSCTIRLVYTPTVEQKLTVMRINFLAKI